MVLGTSSGATGALCVLVGYHPVPESGPRRPGVTTMSEDDGRPAAEPIDADSSFVLLQRARSGDERALNRLIERYLPGLRRFASGRLPRDRYDLLDTDDLVQETLMRAVRHLESFEVRREGALRAYLRQALLNRIRDEARRARRRPAPTELPEDAPAAGASPLEEAIGHEAVERYEAALAKLREEDREAIVARIEMGCSYEALAEALEKPSADAARMAVGRALVRLAKEIGRVS